MCTNTHNNITLYTMVSSLCSLFILIISQATAKLDYENTTCISGPDYAPSSIYRTNLNNLLSRLTSNTKNNYGYYSNSYGQDPDTVYATALCRGDIAQDTCRSCLKNASSVILQHCPQNKRAIIVNDLCMLHFTNHSIDGYTESDYRAYFRSQTNVTDWDKSSYVITNLLSRLRWNAGKSDNPNRKFGAGHVATSTQSSETVYGVVQCQPDLTVPQCNDCLEGAFSELPKCCYNKSGGAVFKFNCYFRYENFRFFEAKADAVTVSLSPKGSPPPPPPADQSINTEPSDSTHHGKGNNNRSHAVIAKAVPAVAFAVLLIFVCIYLRVLRKSPAHFEGDAAVDNEINQVNSSQFDFDTISVATNHFSNSHKLGQGGFGLVYKGMLSNDQEIAVKRLSRNSSQGDIEFKNEVLLMTRLQHRNLVRLLGFCFEREERLIVYEFLPNKSLDYFLFDPIKQACLDWKTRYKIIEGIACGLLYLHEDSQQRIIHRDLKSSNILLDADMNPKISDFGLARLFDLDQTQAIASRIVGTLGYIAPEYARRGNFSVKSDVFSFGVIILEIVSGQKNGEFHDGGNAGHLLSVAWKNWMKGAASNIVDPTLDDGPKDEIERCIHIGLLCVQEKVADRPTLGSVLLMLNSISFYLPVPLQPAFFMNDKSTSNNQVLENGFMATRSSEQRSYSAEASINDASISSVYPR